MANTRIENLQEQINELEQSIKCEKLLEAIWIELGPYTPYLSQDIKTQLQNYFDFDDSN